MFQPRLHSHLFTSKHNTIMLSRSTRLLRPARTALRAYATESKTPGNLAPLSNVPSQSTPSGQSQTDSNSSKRQPRDPAQASATSQQPTKKPKEKSPKTGYIDRSRTPVHLMTLADLSTAQISTLINQSIMYKHTYQNVSAQSMRHSLSDRTIALMFSKRSTRTRVASESAVRLLGGHPMFLGAGDIQLGVNESLRDSAQVVGSMVDGIMARVGEHSEIEVSFIRFHVLHLYLSYLIANSGRLWPNIVQSQ